MEIMEKKSTKKSPETAAELREYYILVKDAVADKSYFKDATNWYLFRYVRPLSDRTMLIFSSIIAAISLYFLVQIFDKALPLVERKPIIIEAKDQSLYVPHIKYLKSGEKKNEITADEATLKYLLEHYVKEREGYDYREGNIEDVNIKFNKIKNNSSSNEYRNFQVSMSKDNVSSPIHSFGLNVRRDVKITSVRFLKEKIQKTNFEKFIEFLSGKIPTNSEVRFVVVTRVATLDGAFNDMEENYLAKINFVFSGIKRDEKSQLGFVVNGYKLYKVK
jgi:type IV secretory pathway component VirB8